MFVSTIIATIGRDCLDRAVCSALEQGLEESEVVVVNDSGRPLRESEWLHSAKVQVITTQRHERCVARNAGAAVARGRYLHFLDDDDWLLPGGLRALQEVADATGGPWLYGGTQLVDRNDKPLIELHHGLVGNCALQVMAGEWIPLQSSLFDSQLFSSVGAFNPLIPGAEDTDLNRRVSIVADLSGTDEMVSCVRMGEVGSTTDYRRSRRSALSTRESLLDRPKVFRRLRSSAASPYWHGRLMRVYLTSAVWNLREGRLTTAASRLACALAGLALAGAAPLHGSFWRAPTKAYESETFERGFREARGR